MADFQRDSSGDIELVNGDFVWLTGPDAIRQDIEFRLHVAVGECVYDQAAGTPWLQVLFQESTSDLARRFILREIVRQTPGVLECSELELDVDPLAHHYTITGTAITIDGDVTFNLDGTAKNAT